MNPSVFENHLKDVDFDGWDFMVRMDGNRAFLQVGFCDYDAREPKGKKSAKIYQHGRKWMLSPYMTKSEVIQTAFKAVMTAMEHEVREKFRYKGKPVFGPHFNVDTLYNACGQETSLDIRPLPQTKRQEVNA